MNEKLKNNKKLYIIIGIISIAIVIFLIFLLSNANTKEKTMNCKYSINVGAYKKFDVNFDIFYGDKINNLIGKIEVVPSEQLVQNFDNLYSYLDFAYKKINQTECISVNLSKDELEKLITIKYNIEPSKCGKEDKDALRNLAFSDIDLDNSASIDDFVEKIKEVGGVCVEK